MATALATSAQHSADIVTARAQLKAELKRRNFRYEAISKSLRAMSANRTPENIANKISRGKFTAVFFLQCMEAIGARTIHLDNVS